MEVRVCVKCPKCNEEFEQDVDVDMSDYVIENEGYC